MGKFAVRMLESLSSKDKTSLDNKSPERIPKTAPPALLILEKQSEPKEQNVWSHRLTTTKIGYHDKPR